MTHSNQPQAYKNSALDLETRVEDLLGRMTLEEKAGLLFQTVIMVGPDVPYDSEDPVFPFGYGLTY